MSVERFQPLAPALLRIALGSVFVAHAYLKVGVLTWNQTLAFFARHGFPPWTAYPVFMTELACGLMLLVGYRVRLAALLLLPVAGGALVANFPNGWRFSAPGGGWEYTAFLFIALVVQALLGGGHFRSYARREGPDPHH